ncbi:TPA: hypothetical protein L6A41_35600 [Pseudomonas aeruginosa]|nr:hypothetical protein AO963_19310 [Pseudomonas aeruginosa]KSR47736.1 hypothetical protein APB53_04700 [Pseudomonas aeruginosa]RKF96196.1 hypothetical protein CKA44_34705 [Pseudomonas aeruginosa]RKG20300.1 hypothetical protein CKA47_28570 [Pseudomonas aeruginosa]RLR27834.1 hypothetical protein CKA53_35360 [Pseudomonas aeruginosa]
MKQKATIFIDVKMTRVDQKIPITANTGNVIPIRAAIIAAPFIIIGIFTVSIHSLIVFPMSINLVVPLSNSMVMGSLTSESL